MVMEINHFFHSRKLAQTSASYLLEYNIDTAICNELTTNSINVKIEKLLLIPSNTIEYIKSKLKQRIATYSFVKKIECNFSGKIVLNRCNGTAVLLEKKIVYKFYFKDIKYYEQLYKHINPAISHRSLMYKSVLIIEQSHYLNKKQIYDVDMIDIRKELKKINQIFLNDRMKTELSPFNKIKQLLKVK